MEDMTKHTFDSLKKVRLSDSERIQMKNNLRAYMNEHPTRAAPHGVMWHWFTNNRASLALYAPVCAAFVLVVGIGTSYAAEGALPGDILYAVKVRVNEPLQGALATTELEQATFNTRVLDRRLDEAQVLLSEKSLSKKANAELQARIEHSIEAFDVSVTRVVKSDNESAIATVQSKLKRNDAREFAADTTIEASSGAPQMTMMMAQDIEIGSHEEVVAEVSVQNSSSSVLLKESIARKKEIAERSLRALRERSIVDIALQMGSRDDVSDDVDRE